MASDNLSCVLYGIDDMRLVSLLHNVSSDEDQLHSDAPCNYSKEKGILLDFKTYY